MNRAQRLQRLYFEATQAGEEPVAFLLGANDLARLRSEIGISPHAQAKSNGLKFMDVPVEQSEGEGVFALRVRLPDRTTRIRGAS